MNPFNRIVGGFQPRQAQRPANNAPPGGMPAPTAQAPLMNGGQMQAPQAPQGPIGQASTMRGGNMTNGGMMGTAAGKVAGIMNSNPDQGGVVAGGPGPQMQGAPGLPPGIDLNDPKNAALAGYMAQ